jgi:ferrous iron transport protein A
VCWPKAKSKREPLDKHFAADHTKSMLQLSGNSLVDLRQGDAAVLDSIDLPEDEARRLMEMGFLPGTRITAANSAPGGDPRVFQVDGSEIALRRETAKRMILRPESRKTPRPM